MTKRRSTRYLTRNQEVQTTNILQTYCVFKGFNIIKENLKNLQLHAACGWNFYVLARKLKKKCFLVSLTRRQTSRGRVQRNISLSQCQSDKIMSQGTLFCRFGKVKFVSLSKRQGNIFFRGRAFFSRPQRICKEPKGLMT